MLIDETGRTEHFVPEEEKRVPAVQPRLTSAALKLTNWLQMGGRKAAALGQAVSWAGGTAVPHCASRCASKVWRSHEMLERRVVSLLH